MSIDIDPTTITPENNALATAAILVKVNEIALNFRNLERVIVDDVTSVKGDLARLCDRHDAEMTTFRADLRTIEIKVDSHDRVFAVLKMSACELLPWVRRNKAKIAVGVFIISTWLLAIDKISHWLWSII